MCIIKQHTLVEYEEERESGIYYCTTCGKGEIDLSEPCEKRKNTKC